MKAAVEWQFDKRQKKEISMVIMNRKKGNVNMKLYEINMAIMECVDTETGEILDFEKLDALNMAREEKIESLGLWVKTLDAEASAIREEEKALAERRRVKENKAERLRAYLADVLGGCSFETARVKMTFRTSTSLNVTDEMGLIEWLEKNHDECVKYATPTIAKSEVTKLLKSGIEIPGAELATKQNLQLK